MLQLLQHCCYNVATVATVATLLQQCCNSAMANAMALLQHCCNNVATVATIVATVATIVATVATVATMLQQCHGIGVVGDDYEDSKVDSVPWQKILIFG